MSYDENISALTRILRLIEEIDTVLKPIHEKISIERYLRWSAKNIAKSLWLETEDK